VSLYVTTKTVGHSLHNFIASTAIAISAKSVKCFIKTDKNCLHYLFFCLKCA